jgi:Tfp pilus assembly protein PilF
MRISHHARSVALVSAFLCAFFLVSGSNSVRAQEPEAAANTARGIQLYEEGDLAGAAKLLYEVVAKRPDDADAWNYLGLALYRQGWLEQRVRHSSAWLDPLGCRRTASSLTC